jgi:stage II sporulation protein P
VSYDEEYDADKLQSISKHISDPNPTTVKKPTVYIYNTHQLENYSGSNFEAYNITPNVMMASYIMREKLKNKGIEALVEENDITEFIRINSWDYTYSYQASRYYINAAIAQYPSLKYFIDIHRDSVGKADSTVTINNTNYAKILFVVGLEHPNYKSNLDLANYINTKIASKYPSLTRGVITKGGANVNGIYNQDVSPNAILVEIGGAENTIDEVYNTVEILSASIGETINEG